MNDKTKSYSEMTRRELKQLGAGYAGAALCIPGNIPLKSVEPLEASSRRYWFRIGCMYFDIIQNDDGTASLYVTDEEGSQSIGIGE